MGKKQILPIGRDDFRKIREGNFYYIDKTKMIKDFMERQDEVALIARPRRFGKTLNMTMMREFFDITKNSRKIFEGLDIMDTEYADQINSRPVVYLTFKDCKGRTFEDLQISIRKVLYKEYLRHEEALRSQLDRDSIEVRDFYAMIETLRNPDSKYALFDSSIAQLIEFVNRQYQAAPILLIDEYDEPIMSSYAYGYHDELGGFFSNLYGSAMKGNSALGQALLTGVQRVAKESIFSQFNNVKVYTVLSERYAAYFGLTVSETEQLLKDYDLAFEESVQKKYNGYRIGGIQMYNPWSVLNYADTKLLDDYWINTSSNSLVKEMLKNADKEFWNDFDQLAAGKEVPIWMTLETAYVERADNSTLWGLLVNSGYLTALERLDNKTATVKIPNGEVVSEFQRMVASLSGIRGVNLDQMFAALLNKDMERFMEIYQQIVKDCTSYMDSSSKEEKKGSKQNLKENAYHMMFLGMAITLRGAYKVSSNLESGFGRYDITLESKDTQHSHVVIEFKQGEEIEKLKQEALQQIIDNEYYTGLTGEVICMGLAHQGKRCEMAYKIIHVSENSKYSLA